MANEVWGDLDGVMRNRRYFGKGTVVWGLPVEMALSGAGVGKDFEFGGPVGADVAWIHRRVGDVDIYFVANRTDGAVDLTARFRAAGREAEMWHADTGKVEAPEYVVENGRKTIPLHLEEREAVFVVFRKGTTVASREMPHGSVMTEAVAVEGPWKVGFAPNLGAPDFVKFETLQPWSASDDAGVKYFSGTATYTKTVQAENAWVHGGGRVMLDLGTVNDLAEVVVNGKSVGVLWKPPYRVDVTDVLKAGDNELQVKVTNEWTNRIAGDRLMPEKRVLSAAPARPGFGGGNAPLPASGLLGPVKIVLMTEAP